MSFRVGILDITAAAVVVIVMLLPARTPKVSAAQPVMETETRREVSALQARLLASPTDGAVAERLAEALTEAGYSDWALRVAGFATVDKTSPTAWQAMRALSTTHAERIEMQQALRWAEQSLAACGKSDACPQHEEIRLGLYVDQLTAGIQSGIDPQVDPQGFREAINRAGVRQIRLKQMETEAEQ